MYYKERIIGSCMHYQSVPNGRWYPVVASALTQQLIDSRSYVKELKDEIEKLRNELQATRNSK